jgi:WD40 repeat protein
MCPAVVGGEVVLAVGSKDGALRRYDTRTGDVLSVSTDRMSSVMAVHSCAVEDRPILVTGDYRGVVRMWDAATGVPVGQDMIGHVGAVLAICSYTTNGETFLATAGHDGAIRRWHAASAAMVGAPLYDGTQEDTIVAMACLQVPDATVLVVTDDPRLRRWDAATGVQLHPAVGPLEDGVTGLWGYHSSGRAMAMTTDDATVRRWDAITGAEYP